MAPPAACDAGCRCCGACGCVPAPAPAPAPALPAVAGFLLPGDEPPAEASPPLALADDMTPEMAATEVWVNPARSRLPEYLPTTQWATKL